MESNLQVNQTLNRASEQQTRDSSEIQAWIVSYIGELLEVEPELLDPTISFERYGLDSSTAYALAGDLEIWLDREIDPTAIYDYPSIESLSEYLATTA